MDGTNRLVHIVLEDEHYSESIAHQQIESTP